LDADEELLEVIGIVRVLAGDGGLVRIENLRNELIAVERDVPNEGARVGDRRNRRRVQIQPRLEPLHQLGLEPAMDTDLPRELPVVVVVDVERLVRILDVMRQSCRKQDRVAFNVKLVARKPLQRASEVAELLRRSPREQPVTPQRRSPELLDRGAVL